MTRALAICLLSACASSVPVQESREVAPKPEETHKAEAVAPEPEEIDQTEETDWSIPAPGSPFPGQQGWYCFPLLTEPISFCTRTEDGCNGDRHARFYDHPEIKGPCRYVARAACFVLEYRSHSTMTLCAATFEECMRRTMQYRAEPSRYRILRDCQLLE